MSYGIMPNREAFLEAFREECPDGWFDIRNSKALATVTGSRDGRFDVDETWELVSQAADVWDGGEDNLASDILSRLGFEWV